MALMIFMAVSGGIMGGVKAAQSTCKDEQQTQQVIAATEKFVATSKRQLEQLQTIGSSEVATINELAGEAYDACNQLQSIHQEYISTMQKMQLVALFIVVIVFMLLLGKKLKLY